MSKVEQLEAEKLELKKELEVTEQMYAELFDEFKKLKAQNLILEADIKELKKEKKKKKIKPKKLKGADRYYSLYSGKGPIKFGNCNVEGQFLELKNNSNQEVNIGYFVIKRTVGEAIIEVTLPKVTIIQPMSKLLIYGKKSPSPKLNVPNLIHDKVELWLTGDIMETVLMDEMGTVVTSIVQKLKNEK
ncbi:unnamed protein product [Caenorhabditis angaria]|uniref:LTD domain-containing protein n=1 Tax=Caenorhabditis angaria TaxID=860376 RepID=A0A9P1MUK8_9PELO|nr:unnamed protein product [Caenorhabditis angaria]